MNIIDTQYLRVSVSSQILEKTTKKLENLTNACNGLLSHNKYSEFLQSFIESSRGSIDKTSGGEVVQRGYLNLKGTNSGDNTPTCLIPNLCKLSIFGSYNL